MPRVKRGVTAHARHKKVIDAAKGFRGRRGNVFRIAKEACPRTQVILMTGFGYDPNHSIVRSTQEGLHCFLFKPFQAQQLVDEVRKAIAEWRGERPLVGGR